jgi:hypothetical protein
VTFTEIQRNDTEAALEYIRAQLRSGTWEAWKLSALARLFDDPMAFLTRAAPLLKK